MASERHEMSKDATCREYLCQEQRHCGCEWLPTDEIPIGTILTAENFAPLAKIRRLGEMARIRRETYGVPATKAAATALGISIRSVARITERLGLDPVAIGRHHFWLPAHLERMRKHLA